MIGSFFVIMLAGTDIVSGFGLISLILKLFIPGIIGAMQKLAAFMMKVILFLICLPIAFLSGSILFGIAQGVFHINNLGLVGILIIAVISICIFVACLTLLSKIILFPINKLIEWLEIEVIAEE